MRIVSWTSWSGDSSSDEYELVPTSNGYYNLFAVSQPKEIIGVVKNVSEAETAIKNLSRPIVRLSREWVSNFTNAPRVRNLARSLTKNISDEIPESFDTTFSNRTSEIFQEFPRTI